MLIEDLNIVLKVAEFQSITQAATHLDMLTATTSAAVKRVEAELGIEIFVRTTRKLRLSPSGERYLPQFEQMVQTFAQIKQNVHSDQGIIDDEIRIALPSDLGRNTVSQWLDEFSADYPALSLRSHLSDSRVDLYRDSIDMALRYGSPTTDANLYGFKICDVPELLCASPQYLAEKGTPQTLDDLSEYNGLFYQLYDMVQNEWTFQHKSGEKQKLKLTGNRAANDGDLVRRWCVNHQGIAVKSALDIYDDLMQGRLVPILPDWQLSPLELWLICPSKQLVTPTLRLLRDLFREKTQQMLTDLVEKKILDKAVL